jgi:hypothetical protein
MKWIALSLLGVLAAMTPTPADAANRHPAYQRARNDIRLAQFLMRVPEEANVVKNLLAADAELELAVADIDKAAILDHKNLLDAPPLQENPDRRRRFERVASLLRSARTEMTKAEDNDRAMGNRDQAAKHIDGALEHIHKLAIELHWEKELRF